MTEHVRIQAFTRTGACRTLLASARSRVHAATVAALLLLAPLAAACGSAASAAPPLEVYFIDVEGGAATLIVSPAGESLLIDSGFPGGRDASRIARVAREHARLERIDHYITTHWHRDHVGGVGDLVQLIPVGRYYGHRIPEPLPPDIPEPLVARWRELAADPIWLRAGDRIPLIGTGEGGAPSLAVEVLAAEGVVKGEEAGSSQIRACDRGHEPRDEDVSDNARSLAFHVAFGDFDLFAGGDLTWNVEHKLSCPAPVAPTRVDAFLVNHHGLDSSNNPALVETLDPAVAIVNSGPAKGAEPRTMAMLIDRLGPSRVFQLHRNIREGAVNTEAAFIANDTEDCDAAFVRLAVEPDGTRYTLSIPARDRSWTFDTR